MKQLTKKELKKIRKEVFKEKPKERKKNTMEIIRNIKHYIDI